MTLPDLYHYEFIGEICINGTAAIIYAFACYWLFLLHRRFHQERRPRFGFLLPIVIVVGINVIFRLGSMVVPTEHFLNDLFVVIRNYPNKVTEIAESGPPTGIYRQINEFWRGVDLAVSFVSNYLLFVAGATVGVLRQKRGLWAGTGLAAILGFVLDHRDAFHLPTTTFATILVGGLDLAMSMAALIWFGWNLKHELIPHLSIRNEVLRLLLPEATMAIFFSSALLQAFYYVHKVYQIHPMPIYYALLMLGAGLLQLGTVMLLCALPNAAGDAEGTARRGYLAAAPPP